MSGKKNKVNCLETLKLLFIASLFLLPIIAYQYKFGFTISDSQKTWGQFGSYFSGIYAPLLSFLTLFLLYRQNKSQSEMNNYLKEFNDVTRFREQADIYLNILENSLNDELADSIKNLFSAISANDLKDNNYSVLVEKIHKQNKKIRSAWIGFNIALKTLKVYENSSFEYHYISLKNLPIVMFGFDFCAALDNFCHVQTKGNFTFNEYSLVAVKDE